MGKLAVLLGVVVVIAAAIGVYWFFFADQDELKSDYTLLDSANNIEKGMTIKITIDADDVKSTSTLVVDSVEDGTVNYHSTTKSTTNMDSYKLSDYGPSEFVLDYTGSSYPATMTVAKNGDVYTLKGTYTSYSSVYTFDGLSITYDGVNVTDVRGDYERATTGSTYSSSSEFSIDTKDGKLTGTVDFRSESTNSRSVSEFYGYELLEFDKASYEGPSTKIDESKGRFGNVETDVFTINGTTTSGYEMKDAKFYVYNGFILKVEGQQNGEDVSLKVYISVD